MISHNILMILAFFVYIFIGGLIYNVVCDDDDSLELMFMIVLFWPIPVLASIFCTVVMIICIPFAAIYEAIKKIENNNNNKSNT